MQLCCIRVKIKRETTFCFFKKDGGLFSVSRTNVASNAVRQAARRAKADKATSRRVLRRAAALADPLRPKALDEPPCSGQDGDDSFRCFHVGARALKERERKRERGERGKIKWECKNAALTVYGFETHLFILPCSPRCLARACVQCGASVSGVGHRRAARYSLPPPLARNQQQPEPEHPPRSKRRARVSVLRG